MSSFPAGCTSAVGFSTSTGMSCSGVVNLPAGCTSTVGYSATTGQACNGVVSTVSSSGEGSMSLYSAPVALTTSVAQSDVSDSIMAFGIKATGSNVNVNRINVSLSSGVASALPWKYFTNLYLYNGSTLIGSMPVNSTSLTENVFGKNYTAVFSGLNAMIPVDTTSYFTVKADIVGTIPSGPATYLVGLNDASTSQAIRGTDGIGLTQYIGSINTYDRSITFTGTSSGNLSVIVDGNNPLTNNVVTSKTDTTYGVVGLVFDLQNTSKYDVTIKSLSATLSQNNANISGYYLYDGSTIIDSVGNPGTETLAFTNLPSNFVVSANTTKVLTIKFDVNATNTPGNQTVSVAYTQITAIDSNSNLIVPTGTATGNPQTLVSSGAVVNLISATSTSVASQTSSGYATGVFVFTVKANGVNLDKLSTAGNIVAEGTSVTSNSNTTYSVTPDTVVSDGSTVTVTMTVVKPTVTAGNVTFSITKLTFTNIAGSNPATTVVNSGFDNFHTTVYAN
jgi:hypothetical protein